MPDSDQTIYIEGFFPSSLAAELVKWLAERGFSVEATSFGDEYCERWSFDAEKTTTETDG